MSYKQGPLERRLYHLSGCDRIVAYDLNEWRIIDLIGELARVPTQEVLQMAASQFPVDVFERHGDRAYEEIMHRLLQWGDGFCGVPVNTAPRPRFAPLP